MWLAWNRYYVRQLEIKLQAIDPSVTVRYWDFSLDSQAPHQSPVWNYLGHNGVGPDHAVSDGPFMNWTPAYPTAHRLRRNWDNGTTISAFHSPEAMNRIIANSSRYDELRQNLEYTPNANVHVVIGGDMATTAAPNDPVFWLVQAYMDALWSQWQQKHPANATDYNGTNQNGTIAQSSDQLPGFLATVRDTFSTNSFCYRYEPLGGSPPGSTSGG